MPIATYRRALLSLEVACLRVLLYNAAACEACAPYEEFPNTFFEILRDDDDP